MARKRGFTLIELLVVIIIICIMAGVVVALMNLFLRDAGTRQGATQVILSFAEARQLAADKRRVHFVVFCNQGSGGMLESGLIEIHRDADGDKVYTGDTVSGTADTDPLVKGMVARLPKFVFFTGHPDWVGIHPTGYCVFSPGFTEVNAGNFDAADAAGTLPGGDIILGLPNDPGNLDPANNRMSMCLDIDRAGGKIRRWYFLNQGIQ